VLSAVGEGREWDVVSEGRVEGRREAWRLGFDQVRVVFLSISFFSCGDSAILRVSGGPFRSVAYLFLCAYFFYSNSQILCAYAGVPPSSTWAELFAEIKQLGKRPEPIRS
jgi:hypothetical protein